MWTGIHLNKMYMTPWDIDGTHREWIGAIFFDLQLYSRVINDVFDIVSLSGAILNLNIDNDADYDTFSIQNSISCHYFKIDRDSPLKNQWWTHLKQNGCIDIMENIDIVYVDQKHMDFNRYPIRTLNKCFRIYSLFAGAPFGRAQRIFSS